jgi:formylmethanofuran:tetrahydromethanopterin formyltransferase
MEKIDKPKLKTILEMDADIKAIELRIKELEGHKAELKRKMEQFSDGFIYLFAMKYEGRNMWQVPICSDDLLHNMEFLHKNYPQYSNFRVWTSNKEFAYAGAEITYIDFYHEIADVNAVVFLEHEKLI